MQENICISMGVLKVHKPVRYCKILMRFLYLAVLLPIALFLYSSPLYLYSSSHLFPSPHSHSHSLPSHAPPPPHQPGTYPPPGVICMYCLSCLQRDRKFFPSPPQTLPSPISPPPILCKLWGQTKSQGPLARLGRQLPNGSTVGTSFYEFVVGPAGTGIRQLLVQFMRPIYAEVRGKITGSF